MKIIITVLLTSLVLIEAANFYIYAQQIGFAC